jgi:hypothetical protein
MPGGTASRWTTRYAVRLTVPRRGGWRVWGAVRADFERALAGAVDPAIVSAEIASELRRGVDYVRVSVALTVVTTDVADALAVAWDAFLSAARDDVTGWEMAAATAQVQPEPPLAEPAITQDRTGRCEKCTELHFGHSRRDSSSSPSFMSARSPAPDSTPPDPLMGRLKIASTCLRVK